CPRCGALSDAARAVQYVPKLETWNGADFGRCRNQQQVIYCSLRVLLLARECGWLNFRFQPIDVLQERSMGWSGIDYLGKQWPPLKWYPERPGVDKSIDGLIA